MGTTNNNMKTKIVMIVAALTIAAVAGSGMMCNLCSGTGWRNGLKCIHCGGDGER